MKRFGLIFAFLTLLASIIIASAFPAFSADASDLPYLNYENGGDSLPYRLYLPDDWETESYPVVLFLHGAGQRGTDNEKQLDGGLGTWLFGYGLIESYPAIYVFPQAPDGVKWVDVDWRLGEYSVDETPETVWAALACELTQKITSDYNGDADRVYITGMSMGGYGTWDMIVRHPDVFAAAIPVCGGGDPSKAGKITIPVRAYHGDMDSTVPYSGSVMMCEAMESAGRDVELTTFHGYDHLIWDLVYSDTGVLDWLFAQKRGAEDAADETIATAEEITKTPETEAPASESAAAALNETFVSDGRLSFTAGLIIIALAAACLTAIVAARIKGQNRTR